MKRSKPTFPRLNPFGTESYFLSATQMGEAKHQVDIRNSRLKREGKKLTSFKHYVCSCGCGTFVTELRVFEPFVDCARLPRPKVNKKHKAYHEVNGKRLTRIELPNGVVISLPR